MVYPNDYEAIVKALSKGLRRRGQLLSPEDALRLPVSGRTLWVTFSPTPDLAHAVARFWVVRGEEVSSRGLPEASRLGPGKARLRAAS